MDYVSTAMKRKEKSPDLERDRSFKSSLQSSASQFKSLNKSPNVKLYNQRELKSSIPISDNNRSGSSSLRRYMSAEVAERLMGDYDDHRRICSTIHHGDPKPRPPRQRFRS